MAYQSLSNALASIDLFSGLPEHVLDEVVAAGTTLTFPAGSTVVTQGGADAGLQVVLEGSADVDVNGVRRGPITAGAYFGEISVIDGGPRSATVTAGAEGLKTFAISALNFSPLIDRHPALARSLLKVLCARIRSLGQTE